MSLQGFCFFDLYFYTLKSQLRYPSLIPFLTLHYLTGLTLHLSGLGWIPTQVMGVPGQSNPSTESQGDTSHGAAAGQTSPLNSPPFELLTPLLFSTEGLLWVRFVLLRKSCLRWARWPCRWHGSGWQGTEICRQHWKLSPFWLKKQQFRLEVSLLAVSQSSWGPGTCFWSLFSLYHTCKHEDIQVFDILQPQPRRCSKTTPSSWHFCVMNLQVKHTQMK